MPSVPPPGFRRVGLPDHNKKRSSRLRVLETLAKFCAILAGVLLTGITLMTCGSLIGRNTVGVSIVGAFELTGVAAGAAIALFMPLAQARRGNIIVDFFTAGASERTNAWLDPFGALLLALIFALLAWRTTLGGINSYSSGSETQIMGFPEWVVYAVMVPAFVLAGLIAFWQSAFGFGGTREGEDAAI